ncbi:secreted protein/lipoprotein [Streptomyces sp. NPDC056796]|uniref:secreted protein/lipoprotein n=1 Tax=Streptomyces sp. NPDC056796 TaxID=3345947 RepID=UPI00367B6B04
MLRCGAAALVLALAGCGGEGGETDGKSSADLSPASSSPGRPASSAAPAAADSPAEAEAKVLEAYALMSAAQEEAYGAASADGTRLKRYMAPDAFGAVEADLARMRDRGTAMRGSLGHDPEVTALAVGTQPPTATVEDCVDASRWQTLDTTTGWRMPAPSGQPSRYTVTAEMERGDGERWTVTRYTADRARSC